MPDLFHQFGADLAVGPTGDLATVDVPLFGRQRVLRRLLTNPGDDIWNPTYGAGLARFIGQPVALDLIRATIRGQIFKESAVARTPEPIINVTVSADGTVYVHVQYADADTAQTQVLAFTVGQE
jgi:phage baseplate assembly protein W